MEMAYAPFGGRAAPMGTRAGASHRVAPGSAGGNRWLKGGGRAGGRYRKSQTTNREAVLTRQEGTSHTAVMLKQPSRAPPVPFTRGGNS